MAACQREKYPSYSKRKNIYCIKRTTKNNIKSPGQIQTDYHQKCCKHRDRYYCNKNRKSIEKRIDVFIQYTGWILKEHDQNNYKNTYTTTPYTGL